MEENFLCCIMKWLTVNSDALMVVITFVYVIATIIICVSNAKSAAAAKKQIEETQNQVAISQAQQRQSVGIQLYEKRKATLKDFFDKKYNDIYWDVPILFDDDISSGFQQLCLLKNRLDEVKDKINSFEMHIKERDVEAYDNYIELSTQAEAKDDWNQVYQFCSQYAFTQYSQIEGEVISYDFKELNEKAIELNFTLGANHFLLFQKMQKYIKASLSLEE